MQYFCYLATSNKRKNTTMLILNALLIRYRAWSIYRDTKNELVRLDDRMLADIGFSRSEIERVANAAAGY
jgi:uncharacterized protein YjiS (DUF1127 family)